MQSLLRKLPARSSLVALASRLVALGSVVAVASLGSSCNLDPVHRAAVNNLGDENGDAYPTESEYHRPGEPCALCHSKQGPADSVFVLAGTVFWGPDDYNRRAPNAYVRIKDANKVTKCFVTNCNGNFFVKPEQFSRLTFPLLVSVERAKNPGGKNPGDEDTLAIRRMTGHIGREPSCATCHIQGLRDFGSPGQISLYPTEDQSKAANPQIIPCPPPEGAPVVTACPEDR
jgi:hypothetical protein